MSRLLHRLFIPRRLFVVLPVLILPLSVFSQEDTEYPPLPLGHLTIAFAGAPVVDSGYVLPDQFLIAGSDTVVLDGGTTLDRGVAYHIDYRQGTISFMSVLFDSLRAQGEQLRHIISISYRFVPFRLQDSYSLRTLVVLSDSTGRDSVRVARPSSTFDIENIFGSELQKSGSIFRGFTVGSNRDLTLNSGLRLQLAGKIASDVEVVASLTDENTPIQPEGTTQTLQEFDKVFVEIRSPQYAATLGDFNLDFGGTEFGRFSRKLQGARGDASYHIGESAFGTTIAGAVLRGKFTSNQFQGVEGVQGPYRLVGKNNERNIIVIAGTEKVYIDGESQIRGETNDYVIDYATGEVTFTTRRLITSSSRIVVDFEYTDRQYARSIVSARQTADMFGSAVRLNVLYSREADDPDQPIDLTLSDSARAVLTAAGDNRDRATLSGVTEVDSNGLYIRVDTTLAGGPQVSFFRYSPGRDARYVVTFSNVGAGKGEYVRQQIGLFVWKGPGQGDYLPIQLLPLPQLHQQIDLQLSASPTGDLHVTGEYAGSSFDGNRFSSLDDGDNNGHAFLVGAEFTPEHVRIGGTDIGRMDVKVRQRYVNERFVPLDRINDVEFNRKWGIDTSTASDERILEAGLTYSPAKGVLVGSSLGNIRRGGGFRTARNDATLQISSDHLPRVAYFLESVRTRESVLNRSGSWLRQKGSAEYSLGVFTPLIRYEGESRTLQSITTDTLAPGSFAFDVLGVGGRVKNWGALTLSAEYEWRADRSYDAGIVARESNTFTQTYGGKLSEWHSLSSALDLTLRRKKYTPLFTSKGFIDINTVLVRNQTRFAPLNRGVETDLYYEVATEQSSRLERVFVKVTEGSGNYRYLGDLNGNGIADEEEFVLTRFDGDFVAITVPTDELFPVIDLKTSARLRLRPSLFLDTGNSFVENMLGILSTETYVRVEEKSREEDLKQIYLLHFSRFQRDATTISGATIVTQDINVLEGKPDFSARLRYSQRKGLTSLSGGIERSFGRERSLRLRWQLIPEVANQIDYVNKVDRVSGGDVVNRQRDIQSDAVTLDFSYRPEQQIEVGWKLDVARSEDAFQSPRLAADFNAQTMRFVYAFRGAGQIRVETSREEIVLSRSAEVIPFELTGGRIAGKTWLWRLTFDYRVTQFVQANINYDGRLEGGSTPVHTARAEVRAFF
jgi:hypothetical protein